ncbi:unnamed protein product [Schistosoma mattheei]|uniref:Uncharacterized protein n=1 Tax=Schistosoma mattheei TaxID=31246 RepID=A0A3P8DN33_9TREM|nr:unnamed protein product [Schistosoma mattheei]
MKRRIFAFRPLNFVNKTPRYEKAVSRTSLAEAVYAWPCESISRGRAGPPHSRPYQGIWGQMLLVLY